MKIGHYVSIVAQRPGYERNVSGHIQIPLRAMDLLRNAGHESHLITNEAGPDQVMPAFMPEGIPTHFVTDARHRSGHHTPGVNKLALFRQLRQIIAVARRERFDLLHLYGHDRTGLLGGMLRILGLPCPVVVTLYNAPSAPTALTRPLWRRIAAITTATEYVADRCRALKLPVHTVRHGIVRDLLEELDGPRERPRHRVLYWRDLSTNNGGDVCMRAYEALAPRHPDVSFDFAIRPNPRELPGVEELAARHDNIHVHRFPYPEGITLPGLVAESICIVLPFRKLSVEPQLAIAESLAAGVPVIATELRSNPELVKDGENGAIVPVDGVEAAIEAIERMLRDRERASAMGVEAARRFSRDWNWENYASEMTRIYTQVQAGQ